MKPFLSKLGTGLVIVFFLFIGLKGCVHTVYSPKNIEVYQDLNETGELTKIYIVPGNKMIVKKQFLEEYEFAVFKARGTDATHYFGSFYNKGESLLGIRTFSDANEVWKLEMEILGKEGNLIETTFNAIGDTYRNTLVIRDSSIEFGNYEYKKIVPSQEDLELVDRIKGDYK